MLETATTGIKDVIIPYTERNNPANFQYGRFWNLREDFMCTLHDFTCMLLSVISTRC